MLLSWLLIYKHIFSPNKCIICNNRYITFKHKTLFFQKWVDNGIIFVKQLFNENGHPYTYVEFLQRYNIPIIPKEYCIVFDAISSGLKCLFKGTVNNDNVSLRSDIAIKGVPITDKK